MKDHSYKKQNNQGRLDEIAKQFEVTFAEMK